MSNEIKGLEDLIKNLNALPAKLEKKVIRAAVRKGANIVRDKARQNVPKDTGNLQKSIITSGAKVSGKIAFRVSLKQRKTKNSKEPYYGRFIEFGTSKMPAKPFMRPALDESEWEVFDTVVSDIKSNLDKVNK